MGQKLWVEKKKVEFTYARTDVRSLSVPSPWIEFFTVAGTKKKDLFEKND